MLHAREDYNRIQDPEGKIPEDEPVFLIRAQDVLARSVLGFYVEAAKAIDAQPELIQLVKEHAVRMAIWQEEHGYKYPDIPDAVATKVIVVPDEPEQFTEGYEEDNEEGVAEDDLELHPEIYVGSDNGTDISTRDETE